MYQPTDFCFEKVKAALQSHFNSLSKTLVLDIFGISQLRQFCRRFYVLEAQLLV